jgi:DMSO/TMAO reductase YedYZ molybdopterin-dependent catalytic subunit
MAAKKNSRRKFVQQVSLISLASTLGTKVIFANNFPKGMTPIAFLDDSFLDQIPGKREGLIILNDRPINAETPPHLLDDLLTPNDLFFVRNNGIPPTEIDVDSWKLTSVGESASQTKSFSLSELKSKFKHHTYNITLECGGNGRSEFSPPAKGNQWSTGAVGCASWTGVRLKDVLESVGMKSDAVYVGYYGADTHISGNRSKTVISRGVPIAKALQDENLIAWQMNGKDIPVMNGYPLRLVIGGWPASCSGKWLNKIVVRNKIHDGPKMTGQSYRVPCKPVAPGSKVADEDMCIIEAMPVKSLITSPKTGATINTDDSLAFRGHAWAGDKSVSKVEYSIDFGASWKECSLSKAENLNHWQRFEGNVKFPMDGYYELWARATDEDGIAQPTILPGWNPRGYLNNACHRIAIKVK